jgi:hypothetical protein
METAFSRPGANMSLVDTLFKVNQLMDDFDYFAAAGMA